jgi:hypothetical protein
MTEELFEYPANEVLVGVRQNQMIINGVVYCDMCWIVRPDDKSLCPCLQEPVKTCEDCAKAKDPCLFCNPAHHANHKVAMAEMEKILAEMEQKYPPCPACKDDGLSCETCGHYPEGHCSEGHYPRSSEYQDHYDEDDPDYREHKYEY